MPDPFDELMEELDPDGKLKTIPKPDALENLLRRNQKPGGSICPACIRSSPYQKCKYCGTKKSGV